MARRVFPITSIPTRGILLSLTAPAPHTLQEPIPLRQPVQTIITLRPRPDEPAQRIHLVFPCVSTLLVHFANTDLYARVILGFYDAVCCGALSGDVTGDKGKLLVKRFEKEGWVNLRGEREAYRSTISPFSFSILSGVYGCEGLEVDRGSPADFWNGSCTSDCACFDGGVWATSILRNSNAGLDVRA